VGDYGTYDERVRLGIAALDAYNPDWRDVVNVDALDVQVLQLCPIGQVFYSTGTSFEEAVLRIGGPRRRDDESARDYDVRLSEWITAHGFDVDPTSGDDTYDELTVAWRAALSAPTTEEESE
jgi:hypothetical protein